MKEIFLILAFGQVGEKN